MSISKPSLSLVSSAEDRSCVNIALTTWTPATGTLTLSVNGTQKLYACYTQLSGHTLQAWLPLSWHSLSSYSMLPPDWLANLAKPRCSPHVKGTVFYSTNAQLAPIQFRNP